MQEEEEEGEECVWTGSVLLANLWSTLLHFLGNGSHSSNGLDLISSGE